MKIMVLTSSDSICMPLNLILWIQWQKSQLTRRIWQNQEILQKTKKCKKKFWVEKSQTNWLNNLVKQQPGWNRRGLGTSIILTSMTSMKSSGTNSQSVIKK